MSSTRRLADEHRLEAALERRVLLDVLAVLVERRGADRAQLAAREHRLEQVGGVHRALGRAGADDRVQLVDEQDDLALGLGDLLEHGLQPVLELAAVLRAGDQRADVERDHAPVAQRLGHVAGDDALGEALDDRGLADAGLADQHGVVLGAAREHLDHAADLVVAADHRVELALLGAPRSGRGRSARAPGSLSSGFWSVTRCGPRTSLQRLERAASRVGARVRPAGLRRRARAAGARWRRTRPSAPRASSLGCLQQPRSARWPSAGARGGVAGHASAARRAPAFAAPAHASGSAPGSAQHRHDDAAVLLEQRERAGGAGVTSRVAARAREPLRGGEGLLGLDREAVCLHRKSKSGIEICANDQASKRLVMLEHSMAADLSTSPPRDAQ